MGYEGEKKREYQRVWMQARRNAWFEENGPCVKCGSWESLEADHVNPKEKLIQPRALWSMSDNNPRKIAELRKLQALCEECHSKKTRENKDGVRFGEDSYQCKLSNEDVVEIRRLYSAGGTSHRKLAKQFNCGPSQIGRIVRNEKRTDPSL